MRVTQRVVVGLCLLGLSGSAWAGVPNTISVQGVLRDNMGALQTMPVDINVFFYDQQMNGTILATYSASAVPVQNGLFTVNIADAQLRSKLSMGSEVWMEILTISGSTSSRFTRQQITASVFAIMAQQADSLSSACTGCVDDAKIASVAASKVMGKVASAATADSVTNGVVTSGMYNNPAWITGLDGSKVTSKVATAGNADTVTNGLYSTGSYSDPLWLTGVAASKIIGKVAACTLADNSTQLGGVAASSYQKTLNMSCGIGQFIRAVDPSGAVTCASDTQGVASVTGTPPIVATPSGSMVNISAPALTGDIEVGIINTKVTGLRGYAIAPSTAPVSGDALRWSSSGWVPDSLESSRQGLSSFVDIASTQTVTGAKTFNSSSNNFAGNGSGLTALNADNVSSGTLAAARLPSPPANYLARAVSGTSNTFKVTVRSTTCGSPASAKGGASFNYTPPADGQLVVHVTYWLESSGSTWSCSALTKLSTLSASDFAGGIGLVKTNLASMAAAGSSSAITGTTSFTTSVSSGIAKTVYINGFVDCTSWCSPDAVVDWRDLTVTAEFFPGAANSFAWNP